MVSSLACQRASMANHPVFACKKAPAPLQSRRFLLGDPCGNRTHVNGVRGRCLNRLTNGPYKREAGIYLFSQAVSSQLSSAQVSLTSVFGMGTGGTSPSSTPAIQMTLSSASLFEDVPSKLNIELRANRVSDQDGVKPSTY